MSEEMNESVPEELETVEENSGLNPQDLLKNILDKSEDEINPWERCQLPSRGLYYDGKVPDGVVEVKPMGLKAEKILTTQRLVQTGESMEYIFKQHVRLPNDYDPLDLLEGDREFILYYLRGVTHGPEYEFVMTCPKCDKLTQQSYDLNELWDSAKIADPELGMEPFKVTLPHLSEVAGGEFWVNVRFMRGEDTMDFLGKSTPISKARSKNKKKNRHEAMKEKVELGSDLNETIENNINRLIVDVMGDTSRRVVKDVVNKMNSSDITAILNFLADNSPGIDTDIETQCNVCNASIAIGLPITSEFFRPKNARRA